MFSLALLASVCLTLHNPQPVQALTIASLAREFAYTDRDGDGEVSASEVQYVLKKRYGVDIPVEAVAMEFLPAVDLNGDGKVPTEELLRALALMEDPGPEMWELMDRNRDGFVDMKELKRALGDVGYQGEVLMDFQFRRADRLRDGRLTVPEWIEVMTGVRDGLLGFAGRSTGAASVMAAEQMVAGGMGQEEQVGQDSGKKDVDEDADEEDEDRFWSMMPF